MTRGEGSSSSLLSLHPGLVAAAGTRGASQPASQQPSLPSEESLISKKEEGRKHGDKKNVYVPRIPHPHLLRQTDVIPTPVLLSHSPFAHFAWEMGQTALVERLAGAFHSVRFSRGEVLPDSPFYLIAKGTVVARRVANGRPISTKRAGAFINWTGEFNGNQRDGSNRPGACPDIFFLPRAFADRSLARVCCFPRRLPFRSQHRPLRPLLPDSA